MCSYGENVDLWKFLFSNIGQGGYSNVYKVCDLDTGKIVVLKEV